MAARFAKRLYCVCAPLLALTHRGNADAGVASRLVYARDQGASTCPDEAALRSAVADRLGYDPFVAYAETTVVAEVFRDGGQLKARARLLDRSGVSRGSRDLASDTDDCERLVAALALAISIALDPMSAASTPPRSAVDDASRVDDPHDAPPQVPADDTPLPRPTREVAPTGQAASTTASAESTGSLAAQLGAGAFASMGWLPQASAGLSAFFRLALSEQWSISAEGQGQLPASVEAGPNGRGQVRAWNWAAALTACRHWRPAAFCALGMLNQLVAEGEGVSNPRSETALYPGLGGRGVLAFNLGERFSLEVHTDIVFPLAHPRLSLNGADLWEVPRVAGSLGAALCGQL